VWRPEGLPRKAELLMFLARKAILNPCHWHAFPPFVTALFSANAFASTDREPATRRTVYAFPPFQLPFL
jgi:hypothetical protein